MTKKNNVFYFSLGATFLATHGRPEKKPTLIKPLQELGRDFTDTYKIQQVYNLQHLNMVPLNHDYTTACPVCPSQKVFV